jgi:hypothetical protein
MSERDANHSEQLQLEPPELPPLSDPFDEGAELARVIPKLQDGDAADAQAVRDFKKLTLKQTIDRVALERTHRFGWPVALYIPANADAKQWGYLYGDPNRYAQSWTNGIGWSQADHGDGSLLAVASSPTVAGAIDGKAEAGLGVRYRATDSLARIRIQPELRFTGRFQWNVYPPSAVWVSVRAVATIQVGGFQLDPVTNRWSPITTSPWRRFTVFDRTENGSGESPLQLTPFDRTGSKVSGEVLVEGGRTYLLSVVAQVSLRITTTDSAGRHVRVTDGRFDTFGSLVGLVPELWLDKTVYIA